MKDLRILYTDSKGNRILKEYDLIMEFMEEFELGEITCGTKVFAEFFENHLHHKEFNNLKELYDYCNHILT